MRSLRLIFQLAVLFIVACGAPSDPTHPSPNALSADGASCMQGTDCMSGNCVDALCCNAACGGSTTDCQSCKMADTGQPDGTCAPLLARKTCGGPDIYICTAAGFCDGVSTACGPGGNYQTTDNKQCTPSYPTNDCWKESKCTGNPGCSIFWQPVGLKCNKMVGGTPMCGQCNGSGVCGGVLASGVCT